MNIDNRWETLGHGLAALTLTAGLAGCGGSSGSNATGTAPTSVAVVTPSVPSAPPSTPTSGGPSSSPGNSSGSPPGGSSSGGSTGGSSTSTILFEQPQESGIAGQLFVPPAAHHSPPQGVFELVLWQPNPSTATGQLVPTAWDAASQTGFTPSSSLSTTQLGFQNKPGSSTAQMDGDTVGAYLNSADLPGSPAGQKMMITPQFLFATGNQPVPFASSNSVLSASMDLQIPTAAGNSTYIVADFMFVDPNGARISYGVKIFNNGSSGPSLVGGNYNPPSNVYELNSPLEVGQRFITQVQGSASATGTPWLGWRHFEWSISHAQFVDALNYLTVQFPGKVRSTDPTQYVLAEVHLNAEFHFQPAPAELGWSMRGWKVWTTG